MPIYRANAGIAAVYRKKLFSSGDDIFIQAAAFVMINIVSGLVNCVLKVAIGRMPFSPPISNKPENGLAMKSGIKIKIPGFANLHIRAACSDYTGTLSCEGKLINGVRKRLRELERGGCI